MAGTVGVVQVSADTGYAPGDVNLEVADSDVRQTVSILYGCKQTDYDPSAVGHDIGDHGNETNVYLERLIVD